MYYKLVDNRRVYTLNPKDAESAHPAKYSIEDKMSKYRIEIKKRYSIKPFDE